MSNGSTDKQKKGNRGERWARTHLTEKGYGFVKRNFRQGRAEVDLIMKTPDGKTLVFIEVKTRKDDRFGYPEQFVSKKQKGNIQLASEYMVEMKDWQGHIRFDIVAIITEDDEIVEIVHFEDAF